MDQKRLEKCSYEEVDAHSDWWSGDWWIGGVVIGGVVIVYPP
jgi:hypothetical protein